MLCSHFGSSHLCSTPRSRQERAAQTLTGDTKRRHCFPAPSTAVVTGDMKRRHCFLAHSDAAEKVKDQLNILKSFVESESLGFSGAVCSAPEELADRVIQFHADDVDLLLLFALPATLAEADQDAIRRAVNQRARHSVCILLMYGEPSMFAKDLTTLKIGIIANKLEEAIPPVGKRGDKFLEKRGLSDRRSRAEFCDVRAPDLGKLLAHWLSIFGSSIDGVQLEEKQQRELQHRHLGGLLRETASKGLAEVELTGLNSVVVLCPPSCGHCMGLRQAVQFGHLGCTEQFLKLGADPDGDHEEEFSPLHTVVHAAGTRSGSSEVYEALAKMLIAAHANPGKKTSRGITPLHWAAGYGRASLVHAMLDVSATETAQQGGDSPKEQGHVQKVVDCQDSQGRTALLRATQRGHLEVARWLLDRSADSNLVDFNGCSPLHRAVMKMEPKIVTLLLQPANGRKGANVGLPDIDKRTPLHHAAGYRGALQSQEEHTQVVDSLLALQPKLATSKDNDSWTPVHEAVLAGSPKILELLLSACKFQDINIVDSVQSVAVAAAAPPSPSLTHLAAMGKSRRCLQILLEHGGLPSQPMILSWNEANFQIKHHYNAVGMALMKCAILAKPSESISFNPNVNMPSFERNVKSKLSEFCRDEKRNELKILSTAYLNDEHFRAIYHEAELLDLRCIPPGETKRDGSRQPLVVFKGSTRLPYTRRVLEDLDFRKEVSKKLSELPPGGEESFINLTSYSRKVVHEEAKRQLLWHKAYGQDVVVRRASGTDPSKRRRVENDDEFLKEVRCDLDSFAPGELRELGRGSSSFRLKLIHEEAEARNWQHDVVPTGSSSFSHGVLVRRPGANEMTVVQEQVNSEPTGKNSRRRTEEEVATWVRRELAELEPGQTREFPPSLSSFERQVVHKVASELQWGHESRDVHVGHDGVFEVLQAEIPQKIKGSAKGKGKGKGTGHKGKGKKSGHHGDVKGGKAMRQIIVTRPPEGTFVNSEPLRDDASTFEAAVTQELENFQSDITLFEYPFEWDLPEYKRRIIRSAVEKHMMLAHRTDRQGSRLRVVVVKPGAPHSPAKDLPSARFECLELFREKINEFVMGDEFEFCFPLGMTKTQRSTAHDVARDFGLQSEQIKEQVIVKKVPLGNPSEPVTHFRHTCDGCDAFPIVGTRFHCSICPDFDLCESCYNSLRCNTFDHDHPVWRFESVEYGALPSKLLLAVSLLPLHVAAGLGQCDIAEELLRSSPGSTIEQLTAKTSGGDTPLHLACQRRRLAMIDMLLDKKADTNAVNGKGRSPLDVIVRMPCTLKEDFEEVSCLAKRLLDRRADPNTQARNGDCPLRQAVGHENKGLVHLLLSARADANGGGPGMQPLQMAAHVGHQPIAAMLLQARGDPWSRNSTGAVPLVEAAEKGRRAVVRLLLNSMETTTSNGADLVQALETALQTDGVVTNEGLLADLKEAKSRVESMSLGVVAENTNANDVPPNRFQIDWLTRQTGNLSHALPHVPSHASSQEVTEKLAYISRFKMLHAKYVAAGKSPTEAAVQAMKDARSQMEAQTVQIHNFPNESAQTQARLPSCSGCKGMFALRHAIVIAVRIYNELPELKNAVKVGMRVARALECLGFKVNFMEDPVSEILLSSLARLENDLREHADEEHVVVIYFVGHGRERWIGDNLQHRLCLQEAGKQDDSGSLEILQLLKRILCTGHHVAVTVLPDCCRENVNDNTFTAGMVRQARSAQVSAMMDEAVAPQPSGTSVQGNFCLVWPTDKGTTIADSNDESLGCQLAAALQASPGKMLQEVLSMACEQVSKLRGDRQRHGLNWEVQRPWIRWGSGSSLGQYILKPLLCRRCERLRTGRTYDHDQGSGRSPTGFWTAEGFERLLCGRCETPEACAMAVLLHLQRQSGQDTDSPKSSVAPYSDEHAAFFCAAIRANNIMVLRWMSHLRPQLLMCQDTFENAGCAWRGRPSPGSVRQTPVLGIAASKPELKAVLAYLLEARADPKAQDAAGWNAIHEAAFAGNADALQTLLATQRGADAAKVGIVEEKPTSASAQWELTPIHIAAVQGHMSCVKLLIDTYPESHTWSSPAGWMPVQCPKQPHADVSASHRPEDLISTHLRRLPFQKPLSGLSALHLASAAGRANCLKLLLDADADHNACTEQGETPLFLCIKKWNTASRMLEVPEQGEGARHEEVFDMLLAAGASAKPMSSDVEERSMTPLHAVAFHWGGEEPTFAKRIAAKLLDKAHASLEARGPAGGTPLHMAVNARNWAVASLLLERRADPSIRNDANRAIKDLPVLQQESSWPNADGSVVRKLLLEM